MRSAGLIACVIISAFVLASTVYAEGWYVRVSGSGYSAKDAVGTGYMISLGAGYRFNPYLAVGGSVGWAQYTAEEDDDTINVYEVPVSLGVRADFTPESAFCPYVEAGPMAYFTKRGDEDWSNTWGGYVEGGLKFRVGGSGGVELWVRYSVPDYENMEDYRITYGLGGSFSGR